MILKISKPNRQTKARKRAKLTRKEWRQFVKGLGTLGRLEIVHEALSVEPFKRLRLFNFKNLYYE